MRLKLVIWRLRGPTSHWQQNQGASQQPRPVILHFHNFADKLEGGGGGMSYEGNRIFFSQDFSVAVQRWRKEFDEARRWPK